MVTKAFLLIVTHPDKSEPEMSNELGEGLASVLNGLGYGLVSIEHPDNGKDGITTVIVKKADAVK